MLHVLTDGSDSILHRLLVDTGKASSVSAMLEPTSDMNMAAVNVYLSKGIPHAEVESLIRKALTSLKSTDLTHLVKKTVERFITSELLERDSSLSIAAELTEYVSAGDWTAYEKSLAVISAITTKEVHQHIQKSFRDNNLTVGEFIGT
jgi:predicted Zn-dependent peptidase